LSVKKSPPTFEVIFQRPGLYPEQVSIGHLSRVLSSLQRLAVGREIGEEEAGLIEGKIGLLQVKRGSAVYQFAAPLPELSLANLRDAGNTLDNPDSMGDREYVLGPVQELSSVAKSLDCSIVLKEPGREGPILARIEPSSYSTISSRLIVSGDTAIVGRVVRVGGATQNKCGLRLPNRDRMLFCSVESTEVARRLGHKLYEEVAVYGTADWLKTNWRIVSFKIKDVRQPIIKSAKETFEALRNAGGKGWDRIEDPEAYIEEVSGQR
jgi:hypothetical protein